MLENKKTVELYLDPQTYSEQEMIESIENAAKEFAKKDVRVNININKWGVYVVKLDYIDRDTYFNKLKYKRQLNRKERILKKQIKEQFLKKIYEPANQIISIPKSV